MVRIKERYILVSITYPPQTSTDSNLSVPSCVIRNQPTVSNLSTQLLLKAIRNQVSLLFGNHGLGSVNGNLSVKYLSLTTSTVILRCHRAHYRMLWAALTLMDRVPVKNGRPCIFRVVRVSGTIRKAQEETIRQARALILAAQQGNTLSAFMPNKLADEETVCEQLVQDIEIASNDDD